MENVIEQKIFQISCGEAGIVNPIVDDGFYPMRPWQEKAFTHLHASPHMILNAPMGSGKSWMMCLLSAYKLKKDRDLRCIISVPQATIAGGFDDEKLLMPDGEKIFWKPQHNLCQSKSSKGIANYIVNWLQQQHEGLHNRVLLCTHSALIAAFKQLQVKGRIDLLHNLLLWVDEAHHVKNAGEEVQGLNTNALGKVISTLVNLEHKNAQIGLTTATEFRGDRFPLLTDLIKPKFEHSRFHLPYDEHLASMKYLKSFSYNFLLCGQDYIKAIGNLLSLPRARDPDCYQTSFEACLSALDTTVATKDKGLPLPRSYRQ
jgi:superfamily II DNA or RNA helicase